MANLKPSLLNFCRDAAAIASERAAELYGLEVLERDIQEDAPFCRFLLLSREPLITSACSLPLDPLPYKLFILHAD